MTHCSRQQTQKQRFVEVQIKQGRVRGLLDRGVCIYKGIPYGEDTSGENRFRPPKQPLSWSGVRDATEFGRRCPQVERKHPEPFTSWYWSDEAVGEDCLALNIFTPAVDGNAKLPVMMYIHGGGYANGSSAVLATHGDNLARAKNLVVVTINHRLNLFGFTYFGEMDGGRYGDAGNAGMLDIVAALEWIRENIAVFGGDPARITVFGHSGGGSKTTLLMGMNSARNLFHRAINMAGASGFHIIGPDEASASTAAFLAALNVKPNNLAPLSYFTPEQLLKARAEAMARVGKDSFRPVIDGRTFRQQVFDPAAPDVSASIPFILGTADTEATFFLSGDQRNFSLSENQAHVRIRDQLGLDEVATKELMAAFRADGPDRTPSEILAAVATEYLFRQPMIAGAASKARQAQQGGAPVYMYLLGWHSPERGGIYKAPHTMVVPLVFGNVEAAVSLLGNSQDPHHISCLMMNAFSAFAYSGDPNHPDIPRWDPYTSEQRSTMVFDSTTRVVSDPNKGDRLAAMQFPPKTESTRAVSIYSYLEPSSHSFQ